MIKLNLQFFGTGGQKSRFINGGNAKGELSLPDGSKIEFDGELKYGKDDSSVPASVRKNLDNWENKRYKNKIEYATSFREDGTPIGEVKGGKGSVRTPFEFTRTPNAVFTHNHPREDGVLGGTFSEADLWSFARNPVKTMRATAKEGTYSITKTPKFDKDRFTEYIDKLDAEFVAKEKASFKRANELYKSGKITWEEANKMHAKGFNTALVELHKAYLDGQKQYGYKYTLEKRK